MSVCVVITQPIWFNLTMNRTIGTGRLITILEDIPPTSKTKSTLEKNNIKLLLK